MRKLLLILFGLCSLGISAQAPGGSSTNLVFWLKADAGTGSTVDGANVWSWTDQSGNGISPWVSSAPTYVEVGSSYYPALSFNNSILGLNNTNINNTSSAKTIVMAFKTGSDVASRQVLFEQGSNSTGINIYIDGGSLYCDLFVSSADNTDSYPISANTAYVLIFVYDGSNTQWEAYVNGNLEMADYSVPGTLPADWNNNGIGCIQGTTQFDGNVNAGSGGDRFTGEFMEIIYYNNEVFDQVQREDMFSYLGSKYGITIDDDYYYTGFGSRWWDQSVNLTYHNDVASIVRDDLTSLNTKQAKSASTDALVSVGYIALATNNPLNGNSQPSDEEAFVWGNDDGSIAAFTATGAPSGRLILGRTWYFEEDITADMEISVPDNSSSASTVMPAENSTIYLLADTDADFSSGAAEFAMTQVGDNWEVTANLDSYDYFTFATQTAGGGGSPGPGGHDANLVFWLKADAGTYENAAGNNSCEDGDDVAVWADQSGNGNDAYDDGTDPIWNEVWLNYNPSVDFSVIGSGNNGGLGMDDDNDINSSSATNKSIVVAFETGNSISGHQMIFEQGDHQDNINIYIYNGDLYCNYVDANSNNDGSVAIAANTAYVLILVADGTNTDFTAYLNGVQVFQDNSAPSSWPGENDDIGIGRIRGNTQYHNDGFENAPDPFDGNIMEMVYYNEDALDAGERADLFSYLGAKYAITMNQDYNFAGGGSEYWDQTTNATYHNDIAGWIRDDLTFLDQRQAKSSSSDALVTIANGSIASSNANNGNSIGGDNDYFFWGNNDGSISFSETGAPANRQILGRIWKIEENGSGTIEVSVPDNSSAAATTLPAEETTVYLLADTDADFSSGATEVVMTLNGTDWEATTDLSSFTYFTFATQVAAKPGGISSSPVFWLRADQETYSNGAGTTACNDGDNVAVWGDVSGNNNDAFDDGTDPDWMEVAYSYNPAVDFSVIGSGNNGGMGMNDNSEINDGPATAKSFAIAFHTGNSTSGYQVLMDNGSSTDNIAVYLYNGDLYIDLVDNNTDHAASTPVSTNTAYVLVFVYDGGSSEWNAYLNGSTTFGDNSAPSQWDGSSDDIGIGRIRGNIQYHNDGFSSNDDPFEGQIMEFLYFHNDVLTQNEREALAGYLAMKYGITLDIDYEASGNTPVTWDISANSGYNNDIAAIGRDDESALTQLQGISASSDALVSMAIGSLASSNANNGNSFSSDEQFVMWGNDDGSVSSWTGTGAPSDRVILGRKWKLQQTGAPGNVEIAVPDDGSSASTVLPAEETTVYLLLDSDGDFTSGANEVAMTLNGTNWEATTSLSGYNYFTFATQIPSGPGGIVSNLVFWFKADSAAWNDNAANNLATDGQTIARWTDLSGNGNDATDNGADPIWREVVNSYNPSVDFSTIGGGLGLGDAPDINSGSATQKTIAIAFTTGDVTTANQQMIFELGGQQDGINIYIDNGELYCNFVDNNSNNANSTTVTDNTSYVLIFVYDGNNTRWDAYLNGSLSFSDASVPSSWPGDGDNIGLGRTRGTTQYHNDGNANETDTYGGQIHEIAFYQNKAFTAGEITAMSSYLAVRYGITLNSDYEGSSNTITTWDATANSGYGNAIAGIGRDNNAYLNQKQGLSSDADGMVSMAITALASSNANNANSFGSNSEFILWGHNNGSIASYTSTGAPSGRQIVPRTWKLQVTGTPGNVEISVPDNSSSASNVLPAEATTVYLLLDTDNDFSSGATEVAMSLNGTEWEATTSVNAFNYFTFATEQLADPIGPGGVVTDLDVWLRPDTGTSTTTDGAALTTWTDISTQANDATSDGNPPTFRSNLTDNFNFYPTVDFDGTNDRMVLDLSAIKSGAGNGDYTMFAVGARDDGSFNIVLGSEGGDGNQDLHFGFRNSTTATLAHWGNDLDVNIAAWNSPSVTPYLLSGWYNGSGRVIEEFRDGNFNRNTDGNTTDLSGSKTNYLGDLQSVGNYNGRITEVAVFSNDITALEKLQVYTYFILKYGLTYTNDNDDDGTPNETISGSVQEGDLVASDGTTLLWDYSTMGATFFNDIAGIGYDTLSALNHKQSKSVSSDALVTIGLGSIAASNAANASSFSNHLDFLLWGNDNGSLNGAATNADLVPQSGAVDQLQRTWVITENGSVGSVQVAFPKASIDSYLSTYTDGGFYLRVADDAGLTTNATDIALSEVTINGVASYACTNDFNGTKYFSIVQKDFIVWDGTEWRGGLSTITDHAPSDEAGDATKPMYILSGDTAVITEAVVVDSVDIAATAVLRVDPLNCLRTTNATNSGTFILEADGTGFAQYKGPAIEATIKQYVDNDGWHLIGSPFSDATWDDLSFENSTAVFNHPVGGTSLDSCNYCNLWWYDGSTDNGQDIGFMASTAYGTWRTSSDGTEAFTPTKGWNMYFDANQNFGSAPWTIVFSGTVNDGPVTQVVNENNSGWNLVANPYPTVLDWDVIDDDLAGEGIAAGYHIWDHANTNFAVYSGGSGTLGATQYIAPLQGFYVQTATAGAQASGDVFRNFNLDNGDRPDPCQNGGGNIFKSRIVEKQDIKLRTTHLKSGKQDEVVIQLYDGALRHYAPEQDIRKLLTNYEDVPSVYTRKGNTFSAITAMPLPYGQDSIPLGVYTKDGSTVKIEVVEAPFGYSLFLEDIVTGRWYNLEEPHQFEQMANYPHRFVLHYADGDIQTRDWQARNPFDLYLDEDGMLVIKSLKRLDNTEWNLFDMSGKVVASGTLSALNGTTDRVYVGNLVSGVYIFALQEGDVRYTEKLPKLR